MMAATTSPYRGSVHGRKTKVSQAVSPREKGVVMFAVRPYVRAAVASEKIEIHIYLLDVGG